MKKTIQIRGAIVGADYDQDFFDSYIEKGMLIPESRVRAQLKDARNIDLYINSQGGSIWAGSEIANALNAHIDSGNKVEIRVGALAASMAAGLLVMIKADKITLAANTQLMFHSAASYTEGGPGAMQDTKDVLDNFNNSVIAALVAKCGGEAADYAEWFAEGRMKWLTAQQALEMGMVDAIENIVAEKPVAPAADDFTAFASHNLDAAAFAMPESPVAEVPEVKAEDPDPEPESIKAFRIQMEARITGLQSAKDKEISALKIQRDELDNALISAKGEISSFAETIAKFEADNKALAEQVSGLTSKNEKLQQDLAASGEQLARAHTSLKQLGAGALSHGEAVASFKDAVSKVGYAEARKQHPDHFAAYMASNVPVQKKKG